MLLSENNKTDWTVERHRVKVPTIGWIRLKEYGYISKNTIVKVVQYIKEQEDTMCLYSVK